MLRDELRIVTAFLSLLIVRAGIAAEALPEKGDAITARTAGRTIRYGESVGISPTDESLPSVCQRMPDAEGLFLVGYSLTDDDQAALRSLPKLQKVSFCGDRNIENVAQIARLDSLKEFNYFQCMLPDESFRRVSSLKHLERLRIAGKDLSDSGLASIGELSELRELHLYVIGKAPGEPGFAALEKLSKLHNLGIVVESAVPDESLRFLRSNAALEKLAVKSDSVTGSFLSNLPDLKSLRTLSVDGDGLTVEGMSHLRGASQLTSLNLAGDSLNDETLQPLESLRSLKSLKIQSKQIGDAGLAHLKGLTQLETLDLYHTSVTDAGLESLRDITNLKSLNLQGTRVTAAGVDKLRAVLPNCVIKAPIAQ